MMSLDMSINFDIQPDLKLRLLNVNGDGFLQPIS
jgi:hypothetical protein